RVSGRDAVRGRTTRRPHWRGSHHLRRTPQRRIEALDWHRVRVAPHAVAAAVPLLVQTDPVSTRQRVVMVATSYPRFDGDTVGTFMRPIATGLAARGHEVHMVLPWHPRLERAPSHEGVHF